MDTSPTEYQPCPLQFYEFQQLDSSLHCPVYSEVLANPGRMLQVESIRVLHSELISLQDSVQSRIGLLESEVAMLDSWQVKREYRKRKHSDGDSRPYQSETPLKKQKPDEPKLKKLKQKKPQDLSSHQSDSSKGSVSSSKAKVDVPDRFWASVEPYCADITESDIKMLQEGIKDQENDDSYSIPPLGVHYSQKWAADDIHEEREVSMKLNQLANPFSEHGGNSGQWPDESGQMLKYADSAKGKSQCGPLTERLIAAFIEDPSGSSVDDIPHSVMSAPGALPMQTLENKIMNELTALGLWDPEDDMSDDRQLGDDEILAELKRKQEELKSISEYNSQQRYLLCKLAKQEMKRQEMRQAAKEADEEVLSWLQRIVNIKQKRKGQVGKREKESAWKALQHREDIQRKMNYKL